MWPWHKRIERFEFKQADLDSQWLEAKRARLEMGVEPDSLSWDTVMDLGVYFLSICRLYYTTPRNKQVVDAIQKLVTAAEAEMDFDKVTVAVGMLAYIAFPPHDDERDEDYNERVGTNYAIYKTQGQNYDAFSQDRKQRPDSASW